MIFFKEKFAWFREKSGLTMKQVAEACGVVESTVSSWESGTNTPRAARIPKLAAALHCAEGDLAQYGPIEKTIDSLNERHEQVRDLLFGADVGDEIDSIARARADREELCAGDPERAEDDAEIRENLSSMFVKMARQLQVEELPIGALENFRFGLIRALIKTDMAAAEKEKALRIVENFS